MDTPAKKDCPDCLGEGWYPCVECGGTGQLPCDDCHRTGWVDDPSDGGTMICPECDGGACLECKDGDIDCTTCDGTGEIDS